MARKKWKKKKRMETKEELKPEPKKSNNAYIVIAIILVAVAGYYIFVPRTSKPSFDTSNIQGEFILVEGKANTHEPGKVKMIEFFDFFCSHCYSLHKSMPLFKNRYGEKLEVTLVGFPLRKASFLPLEAYEIAIEQGKGEEMMDALFSAIHDDKKELGDIESLTEIAEAVGLNGEEFADALSSGEKKSIVNAHRELGNSYNLKGTPTLIFDGQIKATSNSAENIDLIISSMLKEQTG